MVARPKRARLQQRIADLFDMPGEVVLDLPRLAVTGNAEILVENHRGIIEYTSDVIRMNTTRGELAISGMRLAIRFITREEIKIYGRIRGIEFRDWEGV